MFSSSAAQYTLLGSHGLPENHNSLPPSSPTTTGNVSSACVSGAPAPPLSLQDAGGASFVSSSLPVATCRPGFFCAPCPYMAVGK